MKEASHAYGAKHHAYNISLKSHRWSYRPAVSPLYPTTTLTNLQTIYEQSSSGVPCDWSSEYQSIYTCADSLTKEDERMREIRIQIDSKSPSSAQALLDLPGPSRRAVSSRVYFKNIKLDIFIDTTTHILRSWISRRLVAYQLVVYYRSGGEDTRLLYW